MKTTVDSIMSVLKDVHKSSKEISGVLVVKEGLEGVIMFPESFQQEITPIWEPLSKCLNYALSGVKILSIYGLKYMSFRIFGYSILFYPLESSDTALIVFVKDNHEKPSLALPEIGEKAEEARNKIIALIQPKATPKT
ncbi:Uncharacterised protein [uncultured archaeon]|nr:Uncharacterised protein [uncultured archaeon]